MLSANLVLVALKYVMTTALVLMGLEVRAPAHVTLVLLGMLASTPARSCATVMVLRMPQVHALAILASQHPTVLTVLKISMVQPALIAMLTTLATAKVLATRKASVCALLVVLVRVAMHAALIVSTIRTVCCALQRQLAAIMVLAVPQAPACVALASLVPTVTNATATILVVPARHVQLPVIWFATAQTVYVTMVSLVPVPVRALLPTLVRFATTLSLQM